MHGPINVKSPNNISKWQMGFNSAFKGLKDPAISWAIWKESIIYCPIPFRAILILSFYPLTDLLHGLFSSSSSTKTFEVFPFCSMRSTCSAHLILLHLFILMIFCKVLIIQSFTPPVSSIWVPKFLSAPQFIEFFLTWDTKFHIHKKQQAKLLFCILDIFSRSSKTVSGAQTATYSMAQ